MDVEREIETKFTVPASFVVPRLAEVKGVAQVAVRTLRLRAIHHDSDDLRLARSGTTLRHRIGEDRPRWTLKLATVSKAGLDREEISVPGTATKLPAALLELLTARLRGAVLHEVVQLRTRRSSSVLFGVDGRELVEVVDDLVEVVREGEVTDTWREIEVEQRPGGATCATRVVRLLEGAGAVVADQTPKAVRALGQQALEAPDLPVPRRVRGKDPAGELVQRSLALGLAGLVTHDLGVRRGTDDAVHQLRVSCRRLRSDLRAFRPLLDDPRSEALREELSWLAGSFGAARDTEVLRVRLRETATEDPLSPLDTSAVDALLAEEEQVAQQAGLEALRSTRYLALLQLLHDLTTAPLLSELSQQPCDAVLPPLVDRAWKRLQKRTRGLHVNAPDANWHRARILAKRARYTAETAQEATGKIPHAKAAKRIQTSLGHHQDAVVAADRFLALAGEHPDLAVVCARLAERERAHVIAARRGFLALR